MQKHGTFSTSKNLTRSLSLSELYNHHHHQKKNVLHSSSSDAAHEFEAKWVRVFRVSELPNLFKLLSTMLF
jgi:hypothetical protein